MTITLTPAEIAALQQKSDDANNGTMGYWEIYQWLADLLEDNGVSATDSAVL